MWNDFHFILRERARALKLDQVLTYCMDNAIDKPVWDMADQGKLYFKYVACYRSWDIYFCGILNYLFLLLLKMVVSLQNLYMEKCTTYTNYMYPL